MKAFISGFMILSSCHCASSDTSGDTVTAIYAPSEAKSADSTTLIDRVPDGVMQRILRHVPPSQLPEMVTLSQRMSQNVRETMQSYSELETRGDLPCFFVPFASDSSNEEQYIYLKNAIEYFVIKHDQHWVFEQLSSLCVKEDPKSSPFSVAISNDNPTFLRALADGGAHFMPNWAEWTVFLQEYYPDYVQGTLPHLEGFFAKSVQIFKQVRANAPLQDLKQTVASPGPFTVNSEFIENSFDAKLTPLFGAIALKRKDMIIELIQQGANLDIPAILDQTALHLAVISRDIEIVELILANNPKLLNKLDGFLASPLSIAIETQGKDHIAELLIAFGADTNHQASMFKSYQLHQAVEKGNFHAVRMLVEAGADMLKVNEMNMTPLDEARELGHTYIAEYLQREMSRETRYRMKRVETMMQQPKPVKWKKDQSKELDEKVWF